MSRIPALDPASATGDVKEMLDGLRKGLGVTPNLFRVAAQSPATLEALVGLVGAIAKGSLNARSREAVAIAVSNFNGCDYCLSAHTALGRAAGLREDAIAKARDAVADDPKLGATLHFARLVAEQRGHVSASDLEAVRAAGASDAEVLEIVMNVAAATFTNYLNVVAETDLDSLAVSGQVG
jgi:uncharacterized peroxidase-related enzyme